MLYLFIFCLVWFTLCQQGLTIQLWLAWNCVDQTKFECVITVLFLPAKCWDYENVSAHLALFCSFCFKSLIAFSYLLGNSCITVYMWDKRTTQITGFNGKSLYLLGWLTHPCSFNNWNFVLYGLLSKAKPLCEAPLF